MSESRNKKSGPARGFELTSLEAAIRTCRPHELAHPLSCRNRLIIPVIFSLNIRTFNIFRELQHILIVNFIGDL